MNTTYVVNMPLTKTHSKTNLYVLDRELWEWAKYRGKLEGLTISKYIFELIKKERSKCPD